MGGSGIYVRFCGCSLTGVSTGPYFGEGGGGGLDYSNHLLVSVFMFIWSEVAANRGGGGGGEGGINVHIIA